MLGKYNANWCFRIGRCLVMAKDNYRYPFRKDKGLTDSTLPQAGSFWIKKNDGSLIRISTVQARETSMGVESLVVHFDKVCLHKGPKLLPCLLPVGIYHFWNTHRPATAQESGLAELALLSSSIITK